MSNRAWQITLPGVVTLIDLGQPPQPGPKQVLVRIHAFALNYRDKLVIDHHPAYPLKAKPNLIPGSDGAGVVEEAGSGSAWKKGDRVVFHPNTWASGYNPRDFKFDEVMGGGDVDGTFRQYAVVPDSSVFHAPAALSMEEACTLYTAGVTAYRALHFGDDKVRPGMRVLTQGTGGVSCYAIMIAAAAGAEVIATSSSAEKLKIANQLGAKHPVNYRDHPDWASKVLEITSGKGVDLTVDVVGAQSIEQTVKATAMHGSISLVGMLSEDPGMPVNIMTDLLFGAKTIRGQLGGGSRQMADELSALVEEHGLHPPIAQIFEFDQADKALQALTSLTAVGKIVVRC